MRNKTIGDLLKKTKKMGKCKLCDKPRYSTSSLCYKHYWDKERIKRTANLLKKKERKEKAKLTTSKLKKEADRVFSIFIRQRDGGRCITCGSVKDWKEQQAGHYIPRDCLALRYDERNVNCQDYACNVCKSGNYTVYALKMIEKHGDNILYELDEIARESKANPKKYSTDFYLNIIKQYT